MTEVSAGQAASHSAAIARAWGTWWAGAWARSSRIFAPEAQAAAACRARANGRKDADVDLVRIGAACSQLTAERLKKTDMTSCIPHRIMAIEDKVAFSGHVERSVVDLAIFCQFKGRFRRAEARRTGQLGFTKPDNLESDSG